MNGPVLIPRNHIPPIRRQRRVKHRSIQRERRHPPLLRQHPQNHFANVRHRNHPPPILADTGRTPLKESPQLVRLPVQHSRIEPLLDHYTIVVRCKQNGPITRLRQTAPQDFPRVQIDNFNHAFNRAQQEVPPRWRKIGPRTNRQIVFLQNRPAIGNLQYQASAWMNARNKPRAAPRNLEIRHQPIRFVKQRPRPTAPLADPQPTSARFRPVGHRANSNRRCGRDLALSWRAKRGASASRKLPKPKALSSNDRSIRARPYSKNPTALVLLRPSPHQIPTHQLASPLPRHRVPSLRINSKTRQIRLRPKKRTDPLPFSKVDHRYPAAIARDDHLLPIATKSKASRLRTSALIASDDSAISIAHRENSAVGTIGDAPPVATDIDGFKLARAPPASHRLATPQIHQLSRLIARSRRKKSSVRTQSKITNVTAVGFPCSNAASLPQIEQTKRIRGPVHSCVA